MGGHGGLNILPQKRWNVYNYENREKVRRDEEAAAKEEQLKREQSLKRDAESRLEKLRLARGLAPPIQAAESSGSDSKSKSKSGHINLFEGLKVFDPVRGDGEDEGIAQKRKKMKKEEAPKVVLPEDEKYRLGYGLAGKGVKLPWYLSRPSDDGVTENSKEGGSERMVKEEAKSSGKKSLEELREERLKRERREKERERALLSEKTPRNGPLSRSTGFSRRSSRGGTERDEELELVREELREVQRELRQTKQMMRSQGSGRFRGTRTQEDSSHSQRRPHSTKSSMSQMEAMKRFMVMQPPSFTGEPDAGVAENWLRRIRRILDGLDIPGERRVSLAAYMLVDRADFWWETMKQVHKTETITWDQFERIFLDKYVGEVAKHTKRMEC